MTTERRKSSARDIQEHPNANDDIEIDSKKLKYPKSIFFIISNEFCERFSYYGMRTVLVLYLRNKLMYSNDTSTVIYHVFTMLVYFFPLFGAIIADSWLGKFRTIFYVSIIYAVGQLLLALAAAPVIGLPPTEFSIVGLLLIALGTGGIKPCVAAFGGDQFILPQQERYLSSFFSLFYFSINFGSFISSFLTPLLRSSTTCFGETTCYSLAFLVPAILMTVSIVIFLFGKPLYRIADPAGNIVMTVCKCVSCAIYNKVKSKGTKKEHWLDYAEHKYDRKLIDDVKATFQVLKLFLPLPIFWALFDQQGSRWTLQATRMDGQVGNFLIQPDQMQVINPLFVLAFIPLFETCIYPLLAKVNIKTPLRKLTLGGLLAAVAFVVSALVEMELEKTDPIMPSSGLAQVRVFNTLNCPIGIKLGDEELNIEALGMSRPISVEAAGKVSLAYETNFTECVQNGYSMLPLIEKDAFDVMEAKATSAVITSERLFYSFEDEIAKSKTGNPLVRSLLDLKYLPDKTKVPTLKFDVNGKVLLEEKLSSKSFEETERLELLPNTYNFLLNDKTFLENTELKLGGIYSIVGSADSTGAIKAKIVTVTEPNSLHILWMVPQYLLITMGEVMFSVTGLEFAFTQSPLSMKSLLQASWLLTVAFGNLIVVIVAEVSLFSSQVYEFFLFAGLMLIDMVVFAIMASFYKYVENVEEQSICQEETDIELKNGTENPSYKEDHK